MANNASVQATNDQLSNLTANTQQQFTQLAQQMAMLANQTQQMHMMPNPMPPPTYNMPPYQHQAQMAQQPHMPPNVPAYIPSPHHTQPTNQTSYERGATRRGGRGGRRNQRGGRGGRNNAPPTHTTGSPYPAYVNISPPTNQMASPYGQPTRTPYSNTTKHFANWNYCYTCGFDVEEWQPAPLV
jgi:hypothetical protein